MKILYLCTGNSARSQMAEAFTKALLPAGVEIEVFSAGTHPVGIHAETRAVMKEIGIDLSGQRSKGIDEVPFDAIDLVVTLCDDARQSCPTPPAGARRIHWGLRDPAAVPTAGPASGSAPAGSEEIRSTFRAVRDEVKSRIPRFVEVYMECPVDLLIKRDGKQQTVHIQPEFSNQEGESRWMIGVGTEQKLNIITTKLSLPDAFAESVRKNIKDASLIFQFLKGILERRMSAKQLSGPIGIAQLSGEAAREGPSTFVLLMSMVSLNLAIFNLLPIPILDGGVILLLLVEMLIGRDLSMPVKEAVIKVGFVFLMLVTVFALYNDISKILPAG